MIGGLIFVGVGVIAAREPVIHYIGTGWLSLNLAVLVGLVMFALGAGTEAAIRYCWSHEDRRHA